MRPRVCHHLRLVRGLGAATVLLLLQWITFAEAQAPANGWPPALDSTNTTTQTKDGRAVERYTHGPRESWGYPASASGEWSTPPDQESGVAQQNHDCFYVVAPKNPRENAPLCVVLHSANRTAFDYLGFACLGRKLENREDPAAVMTNSPDDFYSLYLSSTNAEWWGYSQVRLNEAKKMNIPSPAELRVLDTIENRTVLEQAIGFFAVLLGAGNAAGGYAVTRRMLDMFQTSGARPKLVHAHAKTHRAKKG